MTVIWTRDEFVRAIGVCGGEVTVTGGDLKSWTATGISFDSRTLNPGDIFFAFDGKNTQGSNFAQEASEKGAVAVVLNYSSKLSDVLHIPIFKVPDVGKALQSLGGYVGKTKTWKARKIAVTGSVGKTGTKEALIQILAAQGPTHGSFGNLNNNIGVPASLARMPQSAEFGVFEVGTNHPGEISPLSQMIRPSVAIITKIGSAHLQNFGSPAETAEEKSHIFDGLIPGDGTAVLNADDEFYPQLQKSALRTGSRILTFGENPSSNFRLLNYTLSESGSEIFARFGQQELHYQIQKIGRHWVLNSLGILACVHAVGGNLEQACLSMSDLKELRGRGERSKIILPCKEELKLIDDCYNSSPESLRAAMESLQLYSVNSQGRGRRVLILGDMKELGDQEVEIHRGFATLVSSVADLVFVCGPIMKMMFADLNESKKGGAANSAKELLPIVLQGIRGGDVILIKGSRASKMEVIVDGIKAIGNQSRD